MDAELLQNKKNAVIPQYTDTHASHTQWRKRPNRVRDGAILLFGAFASTRNLRISIITLRLLDVNGVFETVGRGGAAHDFYQYSMQKQTNAQVRLI